MPVGVKTLEGLVENDERCVRHQGPHDRDPAALAAGQLVNRLGARAPVQAGRLELAVDLGGRGVLGQDQQHVARGAELLAEPVLLEDGGPREAVEAVDRPRVGPGQPEQDPGDGRLADAVGSHDGGDPVLRQVEVEPVEHHLPAVALAHPAQADHRVDPPASRRSARDSAPSTSRSNP